MNVVFMGSASFAIPTLQSFLKRPDFKICGVVTTPPRPQGRGQKIRNSAVHQFALDSAIDPIFTPEKCNDLSFANSLKSLNADAFVVVAYRLLPQLIFGIPPLGTFNLHASLLPKYRGPAPVHRAIEAGEHESGVTIFKIDAGIDTGSILHQAKIQIGATETTPQLMERLALLGAELFPPTLISFAKNELSLTNQSAQLASGAPKLRKEEGKINWAQPAALIFNRVRAFVPFPGSYCFLNKQRIGIEQCSVEHEDYAAIPGTVVVVMPDYFVVQTADFGLKITQIRPEGRSSMSFQAYANGNPLEIGTVLT